MKTFFVKLLKVFAFVMVSVPFFVRLTIGWMIALLWFDVLRIRRRVAVGNLELAFPEWSDGERARVARKSLVSMGLTLLEFCEFPFMDRARTEKIFKVYGEEHMRQAMAKGKGVLGLTLHLGNGDLAAGALSQLGFPISLISKNFKSKWLNDLWFELRTRLGTRFISPEKSSFEILRALKKQDIVVFVLDQFMGPPIGVRTKFFGRETGTAMGLALMAERTGAPVVPMYTVRQPDGSAIVIFEPEIPMQDFGPRDETIARMTQVYTDKIEEIVRKHPEQWMWIHRRWKDFVE